MQETKVVPVEPAELCMQAYALNTHPMWQAACEELAKAFKKRASAPAAEPAKLWLWKNFVDGRSEYWAFDNPFPVHMDGGDPQNLGEPCCYALFKPSRNGRPGVSDEEALRRAMGAHTPAPAVSAPAGDGLERFYPDNDGEMFREDEGEWVRYDQAAAQIAALESLVAVLDRQLEAATANEEQFLNELQSERKAREAAERKAATRDADWLNQILTVQVNVSGTSVCGSEALRAAMKRLDETRAALARQPESGGRR